MKKPMILFVVLLAACAPAVSETGERLRADAEWMCQAVVEGDPDALVGYTYPGLLEKVGGTESMKGIIREGNEELRKAGLSVVAYEVTEISDPVKAGDELHAVVRTKRTVKGPTGRQIRDTYVIAVSSDGGENWTFVDGQQLTPAHVVQLFPNFNPDLVLPGPSEPVFIRDEE